MAVFLVNKVIDDCLVWETDQVASIMHNLMIIGPGYKEAFLKQAYETRLPYVIQICICGRFVTYIEISRDLKEGLMQFYDLKNDNNAALDAAKIIRDKWFSSYYFNWFMEEFHRLKEVYSDNYAAAEVIIVANAGLLLN